MSSGKSPGKNKGKTIHSTRVYHRPTSKGLKIKGIAMMNLEKWLQPNYVPGETKKTKSKGKKKKWARTLPKSYRAFNVHPSQQHASGDIQREEEEGDPHERNPAMTALTHSEDKGTGQARRRDRVPRGRQDNEDLPAHPEHLVRTKKEAPNAPNAPEKKTELEPMPWSTQFREEYVSPKILPHQRTNPLTTGRTTEQNPLSSPEAAKKGPKTEPMKLQGEKIPQHMEPKSKHLGSGAEEMDESWYATPQRANRTPTSRYKKTIGPWSKQTEHPREPPAKQARWIQKQSQQHPVLNQFLELSPGPTEQSGEQRNKPKRHNPASDQQASHGEGSVRSQTKGKPAPPSLHKTLQAQNPKAPTTERLRAPPTGGPGDTRRDGQYGPKPVTPPVRPPGPVSGAKKRSRGFETDEKHAPTDLQSGKAQMDTKEHPTPDLRDSPPNPPHPLEKTFGEKLSDAPPTKVFVTPEQLPASPTRAPREGTKDSSPWPASGDQGTEEEITLSSGPILTSTEPAKFTKEVRQSSPYEAKDPLHMQAESIETTPGLSREKVNTRSVSKELRSDKDPNSGNRREPEDEDKGWEVDCMTARQNTLISKKDFGEGKKSDGQGEAKNEQEVKHGLSHSKVLVDIHLSQTDQKQGTKISPNSQPGEEVSATDSKETPGTPDWSKNNDAEQQLTELTGTEEVSEIPSQKSEECETGTLISISSESPSQRAIESRRYLNSGPVPSQENFPSEGRPSAQPDLGSPTTTRHPWMPPLPSTMEYHLSPEETAMRVARLRDYLRGIPDPLHTEASRSPFAPLIPLEWFFIIDPRAYSQQSRHFARRTMLWDPQLITTFVRADWTILLQIPNIGVHTTRSFFFHKYALQPAEAATMAGSGAISRVLALAGEILNSQPRASLMSLALSTGPGFPLFSRQFSHHQPPESIETSPRTDWMVTATESLEDRIQRNIRVRTAQETEGTAEKATEEDKTSECCGGTPPGASENKESEKSDPEFSDEIQETSGEGATSHIPTPSAYCYPGPAHSQDEREDYLEEEEEEG